MTRPAKKMDPPKDMEPTYSGLHTGHMIPDLEGLPWWRRILCALGYHDWEERHHIRDGKVGSRLRNQCGHCKVYD